MSVVVVAICYMNNGDTSGCSRLLYVFLFVALIVRPIVVGVVGFLFVELEEYELDAAVVVVVAAAAAAAAAAVVVVVVAVIRKNEPLRHSNFDYRNSKQRPPLKKASLTMVVVEVAAKAELKLPKEMVPMFYCS
jgi:hypothetical protein